MLAPGLPISRLTPTPLGIDALSICSLWSQLFAPNYFLPLPNTHFLLVSEQASTFLPSEVTSLLRPSGLQAQLLPVTSNLSSCPVAAPGYLVQKEGDHRCWGVGWGLGRSKCPHMGFGCRERALSNSFTSADRPSSASLPFQSVPSPRQPSNVSTFPLIMQQSADIQLNICFVFLPT